MTQEEVQALIAKYKAGYDEVVDSLKDFPDESVAAHPIPGKWSAREIVHHLGDSETVSGVRLRRLLSEDNPVIQGYDQDRWATTFGYHDLPLEPALAVVDAVRASTAALIRGLPESAWTRSGRHTESGLYSAEDWLQIYADHLEGHARQIENNVAQWKAAQSR